MSENDIPDFFEEHNLFGQVKPKLNTPENISNEVTSANELNKKTVISENKITFSFKNSGFPKRAKQSLGISFLVSFITLGIFMLLKFDLVFSCIGAIATFIIMWYKSNWESYTFINKISMDEHQVKINYSDQDTQLFLSGSTRDFILKKEGVNWRLRSIYLVASNGSERITQYPVGDWTEAKIDEVIESFFKIKSKIA